MDIETEVKSKTNLKTLIIFYYIYGIGTMVIYTLVFMLFFLAFLSSDFGDKFQNDPVEKKAFLEMESRYEKISSAQKEQLNISKKVENSSGRDERHVRIVAAEKAGVMAMNIILFGTFGFPVLMGFLTIISAVCMQKKRGRVFSFIIAGFNILSFPFGMILSIFTFIVLANKGVAELYKKQPKNKFK